MQLSYNWMAAIGCNSNYSSIAFRKILVILTLLSVFTALYCQDDTARKTVKRKIEVRHADYAFDEIEKPSGRRLTRLIGNVEVFHNNILMFCDSAYLYAGINQVRAYSNIHMEQGDTLELFGDYLFYDGASEIASVDGNVELIDKETHLFANSVKYNVASKIARYNNKGTIINGDNTLTSTIGIYYVSQNTFHFKDSVKIVNPDYVMTADTMDYNTETETAFFTGPSELEGDSIYIYCERGWYDTKNDISRIWENAIIDNRQQLIHGDSLYYNNKTGYGKSFGNISITDTTNNIIVKGNYAWYYREPEQFMVTDQALFIQISKSDSLFLHADTITAKTVNDTSVAGYRLIRAYYGCRIFSKDLQARCDSLSYSFQDSVIRLYKYPVIWSEENQLTSDSMAIFTKNRQTDRMELYNSAFVISQVDDLRFNQVKGRTLTGYFRDNELYKINIDGNGETIYYLVDGEEIVGVNKSKCSKIEIYVEDGKITEIYQHQNPEGTIDPPMESQSENLILDGFKWLDNVRPKQIIDIFKK
jgi:lipopolysaccharide export system protein LptA